MDRRSSGCLLPQWDLSERCRWVGGHTTVVCLQMASAEMDVGGTLCGRLLLGLVPPFGGKLKEDLFFLIYETKF